MNNFVETMSFLNRKKLKPSDASQISALELAFIGDTVYALFVKNKLVEEQMKVKDLTKLSSNYLNAGAQQKGYFKLEGFVTEDEKSILMRARNAKINTKAKNFNIETYRHATAVEALVGYLYLCGNDARLLEIFNKIDIFGEKNEI